LTTEGNAISVLGGLSLAWFFANKLPVVLSAKCRIFRSNSSPVINDKPTTD